MSSPEAFAAGSSTSLSPENKSSTVIREVRCFPDNPTSLQQQDEDKQICWICLDSDSPSNPLKQPCKCPRFCHLRCLARWQLQSAGTRREYHCDFCNSRLPDWREALSLQMDTNAPAIMNVNFEGKTYSFEVKPGTSGYMQFTEAIRHAFQLPVDSELNITFTCDEPCNEDGSLLTLQGPGAYDAAVYCASVSAARRQLNSHRRAHSEVANQSRNVQAGEGASRHQRSHTTLDNSTTAPVTRQSESSSGPSHGRSRSAVSFFRRHDRSLVRSNSDGLARKGWLRVSKKVRALYHRLTRK